MSPVCVPSLVAVGTVRSMAIEHWSFSDALFMATMAITGADFRSSMGHHPKRRNPAGNDITDTIPGLVPRSAGATGSLTFKFAEGSARTVSDGSSTELPRRVPTGVVGVTAGRSAAEEAFRP